MSALDAKIDELYQGPLEQFIPTRTALAKTLSGADAQRVKKLPKPTVVPWAVNQVYWRARPTWDRVTKSGEKLRSAQIAALKGKSADVRGATDAQRTAIRDAVAAATKFATEAGASPGADALTRTFEALSLATGLPEPPGRLTRPLQPAGFEALAGVSIPAQVAAKSRAEPREPRESRESPIRSVSQTDVDAERGPRRVSPKTERERVRLQREAEAANRRREQELAAAARERNKAIEKAEGAVERARAAEGRATKAWELAKSELEEAEAALSRAKSKF